MKTYVTEEELADRLKCSRRHILSLRKKKLLPVLKLGAAVRYELESVERALEKLEIKSLG
jgi:excisionase family DNA binding protein